LPYRQRKSISHRFTQMNADQSKTKGIEQNSQVI
jgi:hypothetical protein